MDMNIKVVNQPNGYACGYVNPETVSLKIKALGWQLLSLKLGGENNFLISADNDSGLNNKDPFNQLNENTWISSGINIIEISPRKITYDVEKIKVKKVKIHPNVSIDFSEGYGLATQIKVNPDSVLVAGPKSILDTLSYIETDLVELTSMDNPAKVIAEIKDVRGFQFERKNVELNLDVQRIVEKVFTDIKVVINDIPKDRNIVLIPNTVECSLRGGISILGKINSDEITATVFYSQIVYDTTGTILPRIIIPENTQLVFTKPARINYIIKKFE
ncbi:MAG: CdaR family protein, partial [Ignavibacteriaceae bacterium]|jgi:YbbR domain-containing protein|nr:CdaR family protein [Ignavibacteriaceae bacterium]